MSLFFTTLFYNSIVSIELQKIIKRKREKRSCFTYVLRVPAQSGQGNLTGNPSLPPFHFTPLLHGPIFPLSSPKKETRRKNVFNFSCASMQAGWEEGNAAQSLHYWQFSLSSPFLHILPSVLSFHIKGQRFSQRESLEGF